MIVGVQMKAFDTLAYSFDMLVINLNNGETMYYKQFNERIDFLAYSKLIDTVVIKVQE